VVLFNAGRLLLLHRAPWKRILPNLWTGIGGKVEDGEYDDLTTAARRELYEETDLDPEEVGAIRLRRTLTLFRPSLGVVTLLYFTGQALTDRGPTCNEGTLAWVRPDELATLPIIPNTARVLPYLIDDERTDDPAVHCGVATYTNDGELVSVVFPD
jgi:8-oxo-dGTP diphosphatase